MNQPHPTRRREDMSDGELEQLIARHAAAGLYAEIAELKAEVARLSTALKREREIVSRIWAQLGNPSYEELGGRSIYDLISELQSRRKTVIEEAK